MPCGLGDFPSEQLHQEDFSFEKKPQIALSLIKRSLERGYRPGMVILDSGYGNNTSLLIELEKKSLKYLGGVAKNRKVSLCEAEKFSFEIRLDKLAESLPQEDYTAIELKLDKP